MTGGNRWLYQKIVDGVQLTSRSEPRLRSLRRAVALAYELPETAKEKRDGGLPRILCKGLAKAFRRRLRLHEASKEAVTGGKAQHLRHIGLNDLDETVEWLAHKLEGEFVGIRVSSLLNLVGSFSFTNRFSRSQSLSLSPRFSIIQIQIVTLKARK